MRRIVDALDRWIFSAYDACVRSLPFYRVIFALFLFAVVIPRYRWIGGFPDAFFMPPVGPTMFFTGFPPPVFFHAVNLLLIAAAFALLVGYRTRVASLAVAGLLLVGNAWAYSFGKIDHDILLIVVPLILAASTWGRPLIASADASEPAPGPSWPVALLALTIALAMLSAALPKLATGWLDPSTSAVRSTLLHNFYVNERHTALGALLLRADLPLLWELADYATVLLEAGFVLAVFWRRGMRMFCALACFFHAGVYLVMDILFLQNLLAYGVLVDWARLVRRPELRRIALALDELRSRVRLLPVTGISVALFAVYAGWGNPLRSVQRMLLGRSVTAQLLVALAVAIAGVYLFRLALRTGAGRASGWAAASPIAGAD